MALRIQLNSKSEVWGLTPKAATYWPRDGGRGTSLLEPQQPHLLYGVILKIKRWLQSALKTLKHNKNSKLLCALRERLLRLIPTANPIIDFARIFVIIWSNFLFNTWSFSVIFKISSSTSAWSWTQLPTSQYMSVLESSTRNKSGSL